MKYFLIHHCGNALLPVSHYYSTQSYSQWGKKQQKKNQPINPEQSSHVWKDCMELFCLGQLHVYAKNHSITWMFEAMIVAGL